MEAVEDAERSGWEFPDCHPDVLDVSDWSSLPSLVSVYINFSSKYQFYSLGLEMLIKQCVINWITAFLESLD